ncbi:hypothetical protein EPK99_08315 [Neorhizobium lilium]|uniref:Glycosyl transferase family 11 n=1 Tax=Neorhizobium lilium TaxID=2503024 RepID=A0A3S3RUQ6_9HYPH|nr:alpha-1,2-fucosyltransferase [Neorhizobium lilium]RWX78595.1 hypothetical protein EPK99_08315 [Neorhizobium lilium]
MTQFLRVRPAGRTANQLLQYLFAANLQRLVADLEVYGYDLPEWNLVSEKPAHPPARELRLTGQNLFCEDIVGLMRRKIVSNFVLSGLGFRMSNYAPVEFYRPRIVANLPHIKGYGDEHVVFHIRGGDILESAHPDYYPVPFSYIDAVLSRANAAPVFVGELDENYYSTRLRARYPDAIFSPPASPLEDFETMRRSRQIAIAISSFSWLAAWLSEADTIHLPVAGMLDPDLRPDIDLLPEDDARYSFYHFDPFRWNATPADIESLWQTREHRLLSREEIRTLKQNALQKIRLRRQWRKIKLHARARLLAMR